MRSSLPKLAIAIASVGLTSCSLESFDVRPCLQEGRLAFDLGTYSTWFGLFKVDPRPGHIWVGVRGYPEEGREYQPKWEVFPDLDHDANRERRSRIYYGVAPTGTTISVAARPLVRGPEYVVGVQDGGHSGSAVFRLDGSVPQCVAA